ncbi:ornithine transcarbamylase, mitochondrial-like [Tubulanus polymorphus]|uniref:ornithine transcarbamylase, mitochondrial-like n=1 Tax=Tubulanus polymorphus TaxID=672921 RepID=UPI003DA3A71A
MAALKSKFLTSSLFKRIRYHALPPLATTVSKRNHSDEKKSNSLIGRHFLTLKDFEADEIKQLLWTAMDLKQRIKEDNETYRPLTGKSIAALFQKRSTRTRTSTDIGMSLLGGYSIFLSSSECHLGTNESVKDTAKVLSGFVDCILARVFRQTDLDELASEGSVPIISAMSERYHPLQILADFQTLQEHFGGLKGLRVAWVGDGYNNILHSLLMGCPKLGMDISVATPKGFNAESAVVADATLLSERHNTGIYFTSDPREAVYGANVIITESWVALGQESEIKNRLKPFHGYQVDENLMRIALPDAVFLHCLPRKPLEVTDDIFYSEKSLVFQEAENRLWTVMAVMLHQQMDHQCKLKRPLF